MRTSLKVAIENLYTTFESYSANPTELRAHSCSCCVNNQEIREITNKPLKELSETVLSYYSRIAICNFGNIGHYKYFLPRLFELMSKPKSELLEDFTCFEKLNYCEWETWPRSEQSAIEGYFEALWKTVIHDPNATSYQINETLNILLYYHFNEHVFIEWENSTTSASTLSIVDNVLGGWYTRNAKSYADALIDWLYSDAVLQKLETAFFAVRDVEIANRISITYTILERKQEIIFN